MKSLLCCFKSQEVGEGEGETPSVPVPAPTSGTGHVPTSGNANAGNGDDNNNDHGDPRQFIRNILQRLEDDPDDADQQAKMESQLDKHTSTVFDVLREQIGRLAAEAPISTPAPTAVSLTAPPLPDSDPDWVNCIGEQRCTPVQKTKPQTLAELVAIIKDAGARHLRVRAIGSGHAFSDVARTDGAILVNPVLLNDIDAVDASLLNPAFVPLAPRLLTVQAGITVRALRTELDQRGLALPNMGGYDGQTLAGTLSTGTHGSGITFGPLASMARSIILVSESGTVYQIEPSPPRAITSPTAFSGVIAGTTVSATLKQSDAWFNAAQIALGCLGVIYAYTIEVVPAFSVRETRRSTTWGEIKSSLTPEKWTSGTGGIAPIVAAVDHFELVINPYYRWFRHACVRVDRVRVSNDTPQKGQRQDWLESLLQTVAVQKAPDLVAFLTKIPFLSPLVIDQAIMTLVYEDEYIDKSYNIFSLGPANEVKGMALELHCDATQCVPVIDKLLQVFQEQALLKMWFMAGPLGVRFVAPSEGYIAPQSGRMTCTVELAMLVGLETGKDLARVVKERVCTRDAASVRVHWGLDMDFVTAQDVRAWYPRWAEWLAVYNELNTTGMWNNRLTDRLGISV